MKGLLKTVLVAGVSFMSGYVFCRYTQEMYYFNLAEERVNEAEEEHDKYVQIHEETIEGLQKQLEDLKLGKLIDQVNEYAAQDVDANQATLTSYQSVPAPAEPVDYTKFAGNAEPPQLPKYSNSEVYVPPQPRIISEAEFLDTTETYVMTLYVRDDTLVNMEDEVVLPINRRAILGELDGRLTPHVNHEGNVFIYNPEGNYALQIEVNQGAHSAEV